MNKPFPCRWFGMQTGTPENCVVCTIPAVMILAAVKREFRRKHSEYTRHGGSVVAYPITTSNITPNYRSERIDLPPQQQPEDEWQFSFVRVSTKLFVRLIRQSCGGGGGKGFCFAHNADKRSMELYSSPSPIREIV